MAGPWRFLDHADAAGAYNMGVDEAILATAIADGLCTLRLYAWTGPWLSLGYSQKRDPELEERCRRNGVGIVRRSTGGSAVLHGADLTYAIAAPEAALPAGLRATYTRISDAITAALQEVGVNAERVREPLSQPGPGPAGAEFDCFAAPAVDELCVAGRKLVGSAQRRGGGGVLQHGSIRLRPDPVRARRAVGFSPDVATSLQQLGVAIEDGTLRRACRREFERVLNCELVAGELRADEIRSASLRGSGPNRGARTPQERPSAADTEAGSGITPPVARFRISSRGASWRRTSARSSRPLGSLPRRELQRRPSRSTTSF